MSERRPEIEEALARAESADAVEIAREQFAHGLLETHHVDDDEKRKDRIEALLRAMDRDTRPIPLWGRLRWRVVSGVAAAAMLVVAVVLGMPTQTSATAMVAASLEASKSAGDRRYEIRVRLPREEDVEREPLGTLDVRDGDHLLLQMRSPWGDRVVLGRNGQATWGIKPDGTLDEFPPRRAWPRWVDFGSSTVLLVPVEELLTTLESSYELKKRELEVSPTGKGPACYRISAVHKPGPTPEPVRVELWIDPSSRVVRRMELHWKPPPGPGGPGGPGDRPPPPEGRRPPRPPPDGGPPEGSRPPRDGMEGGPRPPHPPPEFLGGPPDFERRPPPPRILVFELVEGATFGEGWFESGTHVKQ